MRPSDIGKEGVALFIEMQIHRNAEGFEIALGGGFQLSRHVHIGHSEAGEESRGGGNEGAVHVVFFVSALWRPMNFSETDIDDDELGLMLLAPLMQTREESLG
jgi:hypothetical protein